MTSEKNKIPENNGPKDISVVAGVFVENEKGEILLVQMPQWSKHWGVPGGHVEIGESLEMAALRELKEETGIEAKSAELINMVESVEPNDYRKPKHFVSFQFRVLVSGRPPVNGNEEILDYKWESLAEIAKREDLCTVMRLATDKILSGENCVSCEKLKAGWARAQADYQNLVRETNERRGEWAKLSELQILEEFIPVYDNFKKAFATDLDITDNADIAKQVENWRKGIEFIKKQFGDILRAHGVEEIETVGKIFDTNFHEAMGEEESAEAESGTILKEVDGGYKMGTKVIKPAKVILAK